MSTGYDMVAIGVSAGGLEALSTILAGLPADFGLAICIVQHRAKDSRSMCELLQAHSALPVHEVMDKQTIEPGHVYVGPPDYHLLVEDGYFSLSVDLPVRFSRPSIDVMLESAADVYGGRLIGVVLTGANSDGSAGLRRIAEHGGVPVVQDPATAEVRVMPASALRAVPEAHVVALDEMAGFLMRLAAGGPRAATGPMDEREGQA